MGLGDLWELERVLFRDDTRRCIGGGFGSLLVSAVVEGCRGKTGGSWEEPMIELLCGMGAVATTVFVGGAECWSSSILTILPVSV